MLMDTLTIGHDPNSSTINNSTGVIHVKPIQMRSHDPVRFAITLEITTIYIVIWDLGISEETCMGEQWNTLKVMFKDMCTSGLGRKKGHDREWLSMDIYLEANRREEHGEREDSMQRWATEREAEFNVHCTE
ncbi:unnamed protein product [Trichobilharzia regenti]|nr:unnamed protein product [Trichobilharzia regenti]